MAVVAKPHSPTDRLDEVISHSDIVDKQQQICTDDKEKLANENEALKAQNGDLSVGWRVVLSVMWVES